MTPRTDTLDVPLDWACVGGVLFDIDDTLVDLHRAMHAAMQAAGRDLLPAHTAADWDAFAALYMADPERYYDRYVAGEFSFAEQRGLRARLVFTRLGVGGFDAAREARWIADFETAQPLAMTAFPDAVPLLAALEVAGIPYGCVSNNVHAYQRAKLRQAGLGRIAVVVGIDTIDAAKPAPEVFLEGCRQLGTVPAQTLYVGDNYLLDGVGAAQAGLQSLWLNRAAAPTPATLRADGVREIASLAALRPAPRTVRP